MSEYTPDCWTVLEFTHGETVTRKMFGVWYGGYTTGDSWKLNSGITGVRVIDGVYEFDGASGSTYYCYLDNYGMSSLQVSVLSGWMKQAEQRGDFKIRELDLAEVMAF